MTKAADTNPAGSQRKRNTNQTKTNVAQQNTSTSNNKKSNKQNQNTNQSLTQAAPKSSSPTPAPPPRTKSPAPQPEKHIPLKGYNGSDIETLLSSGVTAQAEVYKPAQTTSQKSGPWGQKCKLHIAISLDISLTTEAGTMATGTDFWLELRKQVAKLQKGESTNKGG